MSKVKMISPAVPNVPWQDKPEGHTGAPVWRYSENPIIGRNPVEGVARIFNSAVMPYGDEFIGVFRGEQVNGIPYIYLGRSKDAIHWDFDKNKIQFVYTQSNSVCYTYNGQTIGVGAGQQSRIHCTRLAGQKADNWQLRHMDKVLNLPFRDDVAKPNRDNAIDVYIGDTPEDVIGDDVWAETFTRQPEPLTAEEKKAYLSKVTGVCLGSDAFFPFGDNIERARRSGVTAIVQPGGSIRDQQVIDTCNKYGIAMAFCGLRLFHH